MLHHHIEHQYIDHHLRSGEVEDLTDTTLHHQIGGGDGDGEEEVEDASLVKQ